MAAPIEFLFEFASPYSYIATQRIGALGGPAWPRGRMTALPARRGDPRAGHYFARSAQQHGLSFAPQPSASPFVYSTPTTPRVAT